MVTYAFKINTHMNKYETVLNLKLPEFCDGEVVKVEAVASIKLPT